MNPTEYQPILHRVVDPNGLATEYSTLSEAEHHATRLARQHDGLVSHNGSEAFGVVLTVFKPKAPPAQRHAL